MSSFPEPARILALDPGTKEMGFALFVGDSLVRYGVRNIKKRLEKQSNGRVPGTDLIKYYKPDVVILGKLTHSERKNNPILKNLTNQIRQFALRNGIEIQEINPADAIKFLIKDRRPTKMNAAALISSAYPELSPYLPQKGRILWSYKDKYWMNMFDALTLAQFYFRTTESEKDISRHLNNKTL